MSYMLKQEEHEHKNKRQIGTVYEQVATDYLRKKGYKVRNNNYRCKLGEIDIIAEYKNTIVFIEVKYRKNDTYGRPCEAVNYKKQQRILAVAKFYLRQYYKYEINCRFDVIEILNDTIYHIEAAF